MKPIEYLYFNIYNLFYQRSQHNGDFTVRIQAMYLFSLSVGGWILFLESAFLHLVRHSWFSSKPVAMVFAATVYLLTAFIFHYIFIIHERDRKIFGKYEVNWDQNPCKKRDLWISVFVMIVPYLFLASFALFLPRHL